MPTSASPIAAAPAFFTDDARYEAIRGRDGRAEGQFFYGVATTGVYCRPTCAARLALRENISFHRTPDDAERAGFRPCKRCRPRDPSQSERDRRLVEQARAALEGADAHLPLSALARQAGLSPHHFHRLFKKHVGLTPQEYAAACRLKKFGQVVAAQPSVTAAIYEAGYSSSSRFYERNSRALGVTPTELRRGGAGLQMRRVVRPCSLGQVLVAATARGICALFFGDESSALEADLRARFPRATLQPSDPALESLADKVIALVDSAGLASDLPLDLVGTAFQQRVWRALRDIPRGTTTTYAALAKSIGAPGAVRAVGTACGANPVSLIVPVTACFAATAGWAAIAGEWPARRPCSPASVPNNAAHSGARVPHRAFSCGRVRPCPGQDGQAISRPPSLRRCARFWVPPTPGRLTARSSGCSNTRPA